LVWLSYTKSSELGEVLAANPHLTWVQLPWAGVDAYAQVLKEQSRPGLVFTSAKGSYAQPVAEHAFGMILPVRLFPRRIRATSWDAEPKGISLFNKNVVIIGAGGIARELIRQLGSTPTSVGARQARSWRASTVTTDRFLGLPR
jgi:phosphoglycerate dehydrogenase-like enzyme